LKFDNGKWWSADFPGLRRQRALNDENRRRLLVEHDESVLRVMIGDAAENNETLKNELRVLARDFANGPKSYNKQEIGLLKPIYTQCVCESSSSTS
jgi:hypothetical protein